MTVERAICGATMTPNLGCFLKLSTAHEELLLLSHAVVFELRPIAAD